MESEKIENPELFSVDPAQLRTDYYGYLQFYNPAHPLALYNGRVYYHRHLVSIRLGRWLTNDEMVHFKDGDRKNTSPENLVLLTRSELATLTLSQKVELICRRPGCGKIYLESPAHANRRSYCSEECRALAQRKFEITREELLDLVWQMPTVQVAKQLGVSDVAVARRCKLLGIPKPPRGYWAKQAAGQTVDEDMNVEGWPDSLDTGAGPRGLPDPGRR
jgi:hypothetical protein